MKPLRLFLLASGRGTHVVNLIHAVRDGRLRGEVLRVVADRPDAHALDEDRSLGVPVVILEHYREGARLDPRAEEALLALVASERPTVLALCGFMRLLRGSFLERVGVPVVNVHPSLLPRFRGLEAQRQAIEAGAAETGVTVHFVDAGVDSGPIIGQQTVPVLDNDTVETLHQRIHAAEHELYPKCVAAIARGTVSVRGRRVVWRA